MAKWKAGNGEVGEALRAKLALKAFEMTARYDGAISGYFREQYADEAKAKTQGEGFEGTVKRMALRYGANPHQKPAQAFVTEGELPFKGKFYPYEYLARTVVDVWSFSFGWIPWVH